MTDREVPGKLKRVLKAVNLTGDSKDGTERGELLLPPGSEPTVVTSLIDGKAGGWHAPVIDLDIPHVWVPSSTAGHGHLYLDHVLSWGRYLRLLEALADAGVVERGYVSASEARGYTAVRLPWIKKEAKK